MLKIVFGTLVALFLGYVLIHFLEGFEGIMVGKEDRKSYEANKPFITKPNTPSVNY